MKLLLFVCAESFAVDSETNRASYFNVLEQLTAASFPVVVPRVTASFLLGKEEGDADALALAIEVLLDNENLAQIPVEFAFQQHPRARGNLTIAGLAIPRPGSLVFKLTAGETPIGQWTIPVSQVPQEGAVQ